MKLQQKHSILIVGFLLLVGVAYQFAFSKTLEIKQTYDNLKTQDELFSSISQNIHILKQEEIYYNSLLEKYQISAESSFQNNLLTLLNEFSETNKMKVINFVDPHIFKYNNVKQETYVFTLEGDFNSIVNSIFNLEQHHKFGNIISVQFIKKKNYKNYKEFLQCTIFLQRVLQEK